MERIISPKYSENEIKITVSKIIKMALEAVTFIQNDFILLHLIIW